MDVALIALGLNRRKRLSTDHSSAEFESLSDVPLSALDKGETRFRSIHSGHLGDV